jgi:hypothetical protein
VAAGGREARVKRGIAVVALVAAPLLADDVYLRGGGQITGEIVEQSEDSVTVDIGGGTFTVRTASIVRIEENVSPSQEYRERAAAISSGDAEAWRELARWATSNALATQAGQAWSRVVAIQPDDQEANRALGRVQLDGRWVGEQESYRARGFVEFEGEWMTPGERQSILNDRRARDEADRQAEQARLQAEEQAEDEREAREAEERDAFLSGGLPQYGDPVYWGWGTGPVYWPTVPAQPVRPGRPANRPSGGQR